MNPQGSFSTKSAYRDTFGIHSCEDDSFIYNHDESSGGSSGESSSEVSGDFQLHTNTLSITNSNTNNQYANPNYVNSYDNRLGQMSTGIGKDPTLFYSSDDLNFCIFIWHFVSQSRWKKGQDPPENKFVAGNCHNNLFLMKLILLLP